MTPYEIVALVVSAIALVLTFLMITGVELLTFNIKGKRITVDAVHIIFFTHNLIAIPVKNGLLRFLVVLKQQIFQSSTVIRIFTCDVFQNRHGNHLPSE